MTDGAAANLVSIESVSKRFGSTVALDEVTLAIGQNELFALLGPSGCGKTTLLRALAGFESPDSGRILLDGQDLVGMPPYRRPFNMMFQSYALFPHMNVFDNVAYGLRQEGVRGADLQHRTGEALEMVELHGLERRRPGQLSGGQRQRVALARALVKRPRLLLLDEPLAALDRKLRSQMQFELKRLQAAVGISFVIVTHDQEEALVMADRAAIMHHGRVLQLGTPHELYERPASRFVATFVGESNVIPGRFEQTDDGGWLVAEPRRHRVAREALPSAGIADGSNAALVVRPERIQLGAPADGAQRGTIAEVDYLGASRRYLVRLDEGGELVARLQAGQPGDELRPGDAVGVGWDAAHAAVIPDDAGERAPRALPALEE